MTAMSDYLESELLDHALGTGSWTTPTNVFVKLHTGAPGEAGTSNASANTTRVDANWNAASSGVATLASDISWLTWASGSETISHISIWDNISAGNCLFTGALAVSKAIVNGDDLVLKATTTTITFA